jgi:hypothetical protein
VGIVLVGPPVMDQLGQDGGVGENDGETDGKTLPSFLDGRDTHSKSLMGIRRKRANFLAKTVAA